MQGCKILKRVLTAECDNYKGVSRLSTVNFRLVKDELCCRRLYHEPPTPRTITVTISVMIMFCQRWMKTRTKQTSAPKASGQYVSGKSVTYVLFAFSKLY